jgi:predicted kinase
MNIIIPIGISGSGKSTFYNDMYKGMSIICPDNIRMELTGDISDQSKNGEVFSIVDKMVKEHIEENKSFFYDATNINTKYRVEFVNKVKKHSNVKVVYIVFPCDINVSNERIQKDITNGKNRSKVPFGVLEKQKKLYDETMKQDLFKEGADQVIFL